MAYTPPENNTPSDKDVAQAHPLSVSFGEDALTIGVRNAARRNPSGPQALGSIENFPQKVASLERFCDKCPELEDSAFSEDTCEIVAYGSLFNDTAIVRVEKRSPIDTPICPYLEVTLNSRQSVIVKTIQSPAFLMILGLLDHKSRLQARSVSTIWNKEVSKLWPLKFPKVYYLPVELIQQIMFFASARCFETSRKTCRAWYYSSLEPTLLHHHFKYIGFSRSDTQIKNSKNPFYLSRRFARECSLGSDGSGICDLRQTNTIDLSELAVAHPVQFTVSKCGTHVLMSEGCIVFVYRFRPDSESLIEYIATIVCNKKVLAVSMDTSSRRYSVAILLEGRLGLVHDIIEEQAKCTYRDLCSEDDSPRSVAICPQRRCVAFGCQGGIELHWVDALTGQELNRWFPLTAPSDFLYFLPPRRGIDSSKKLRLISSSAHPKEANPLIRRFSENGVPLANYGTKWEPRRGQTDHFQAVPLSDGYHIVFIDPYSGALCLGSDAPLGGPTKLSRRIWLVPPENLDDGCEHGAEDDNMDTWMKSLYMDQPRPSLYASGADISNGVRVVAVFGDRMVFFSVPPDVFNYAGRDGSTSEGGSAKYWAEGDTPPFETNYKEPKAHNAPKPFRVRGAYVDTLPGIVDIALESGPSMTVYALCSSGIAYVYKLNGTTGQKNGEVIKKYIQNTRPSPDELHRRLETAAVSMALDGVADFEVGWDMRTLAEVSKEHKKWTKIMWSIPSTIGVLEYGDFVGYC